MSSSDSQEEKPKKINWGTVAQVCNIISAVVLAANGVDSYVHHHPHGLGNHNDWKG